MRNISFIMLIVAVILGAITVYFTRSFIESQRTAPTADLTQSNAVVTTTIVVSTVPLKFGDEITTDHLKEVDWPLDLKPEGSFETVNEVIGDERRVTLRSISINEPVVKSKISGFGYRATLSQIIGEGKRAVTIRVNDVASVGGFVLPGDEVDVVHSYQAGDDILDSISNIILQNVRVLAIDQIADESQEGAIVGKAATVEVTPEEAQKIALAAKVGSLSLALRRLSAEDLDEEVIDLTKTIEVSDLKLDEIVKAKPVKKTGKRTYTTYRAPAPKPVEPVNAEMIITRGVEQSKETVAKDTEASLAGGAYPKTETTSSLGSGLSGFTGSVAQGVSKTSNVITTLSGQ